MDYTVDLSLRCARLMNTLVAGVTLPLWTREAVDLAPDAIVALGVVAYIGATGVPCKRSWREG